MSSKRMPAECELLDQDFWLNLESLKRKLIVFSKRSEINNLADRCTLASANVKQDENASNGSAKCQVSENISNSSNCILEKIEKIFGDCLRATENCGRATIEMPNRKVWQNTDFCKDLGITMVANPSLTLVKGSNESSSTKFALTIHLLKKIYELIKSNTYCTKREIYYQDVTLFKSQRIVDSLLDDIACLLSVPKIQLHVLTTSKGCIAGNLRFKDADGNYVDCSGSSQGVLLPNDVGGISYIQSDARFVLIVEKSAAFQMLLDSNVTEILHPCILITGKGYPDANTRQMVRKLWDCLHIPILGLVDADPYGIEILGIYKYGSMAMSFDVENLAVPEIQWLGLLPSDIQRLNLPESATIPLTDGDVKKAKSLLTRPYMQISQLWLDQIHTMIEHSKKAEIEGLSKINATFLTSTYLPNKIKFGGWI